MNHTEAVKKALLAASKCGAMVFRREVGKFYDQRGNMRRIGFVGEPDVQGILKGGRAIAIEIKTGAATRSAEQKHWAERFVQFGGLYILARYSDKNCGDSDIASAIKGQDNVV